MIPSDTHAEPAARPGAADVWKAGVGGIIAAAILNALVVIVATRVFGLNAAGDFPPLNGPGAVVMFTVVFLAVATFVFQLIAARSARPLAVFRNVAVAVTILSFLPDVWLAMQPQSAGGATLPEALTLMVTHMVAAAAIYGAFSRIAPE